MKNFKEAYKEIVDSIPVPDFYTEEIPAGNQIKKVCSYNRKRCMTAAALAGGIFIIYTLGGVAAAGYARSLVRVNENSVQTMDMNASLMQEETATLQVYTENVSEMGRAYAEETYTGTADEGIAEKLAESEASDAFSGGVVSEDLENGLKQKLFLALPEEELTGEWKPEDYTLAEDGSLLIRLETEEKLLLLHQYYYDDASADAFTAAYADELRNGRSYTTEQGFVYKMADSHGGREIHVAIAVGDYELILDFYGYTETEVCEVLESMDLAVYQ
ncbi:MAG: hypothetical protein J1E65_02815 [Lachnospiraceae bacterium]|nr:hypothetical protein [Lachnospiraceae bacterium]